MRKTFLLYLIILIALCNMSAKAQAQLKYMETYYPHWINTPVRIHEQYYVWLNNLSLKQGAYKEFSEKGILIREGSYNKGKPVGKWVSHTVDNQLSAIENYNQSGELDGESIVYNVDPKDPLRVVPVKDYYYKNGLMNGSCKDWNNDENGYFLSKETTYDLDTIIKLEEYFTNGLPGRIEITKDSAGLEVKHGQTFFYPDGLKKHDWIQVTRNQYVMGAGTEIYWYDNKDHTIQSKFTFSLDFLKEMYTYYDENGNITDSGTASYSLNTGKYVMDTR